MDWERTGDEQRTWSWVKITFPDPLTPLVQSSMPYATQGWAKANRSLGTPGATRIRFVDGYFYTSWAPDGLTTWEAADVACRAAERVVATRWAEEWLPEVQADLARLRSIDLPALIDGDLARALQDVLLVRTRQGEIHAHLASSPAGAVERLVDWYLQRFPGSRETAAYTLLQGQSNTSVESVHHLWQLSRMLTPEIEAILLSAGRADLPEPFRSVFEGYLDQFGHRTHMTSDPASPTWYEDPSPVVRLILSYAANSVPDPYLEVARLAAEREAFTMEVRVRLATEERAEFDDLLATALAAHPLTEDHAFWLDQQGMAALRRVCAEFGRRMVAAGALDDPFDIAYLTLDELLLWGFGLADPLRPRIAARRVLHAAQQQITTPDFLGAPPSTHGHVDRYGGPTVAQEAGPREVRGVPASAGVVRGVARVVRSIDEAQSIRRGEILVCIATEPNWTPLFGVAAALVTDIGGSLSHAAVVAREYRLPAVVGTRIATQTIHSGQLIEVDGEHGLVRLL
jgi:phosphohistidine swiveling domain-containing protein